MIDSADPQLAGATYDPASARRFRYVGSEFEPTTGVLTCRYAVDDLEFVELIGIPPVTADRADDASLRQALRLVFLLAGISYYKVAAPPVIEVDEPGLTPAERRLLEAFYLDGLGEYAFRSGLDLSDLRIVAADRPPVTSEVSATAGHPLIPFGGGLDSIVTVEGVRAAAPDAALFVVTTGDVHFEAIEDAAVVTGLPIVRANRTLDPKVLRSRQLGYRNGHVPVTGILSAIAVASAIAVGRDAVIMSNEWSASSGNVESDGRMVNHQWSKSLDFEDLFRSALTEAIPAPFDYFSWLRPRSELWVADQFLELERYHLAFRSCNRAFHIDRTLRLDHWCGHCDKCVFIDLILAPFLPRERLEAIFGGREPLANADLVPQFRALLGLSGEIKPFECVGDVDECRVASLLAADRPDRSDATVLSALASEVRTAVGDVRASAETLLRPLGSHRIPDRYAPSDLLG